MSTFTFLPESGEPATLTKTLPAKSRITVNIEAEMPGAAAGPGRDAGDRDAAGDRRARAVPGRSRRIAGPKRTTASA